MFNIKKHQLINLGINSEAVKRYLAAPTRRNAPLRAVVAAASVRAAEQRTPAAVTRKPNSPSWHGKVRSYVAKGQKRKEEARKFSKNLARARPSLQRLTAAARRAMNINALIAKADAAERNYNNPSENNLNRKIKRAEFFRTRNAVLAELDRRARDGDPRVRAILKNINKRKHNIVVNINYANSTGRYLTWRQTVAQEQGGEAKHVNHKHYRNSSPRRPSPPRPNTRPPNFLLRPGALNEYHRLMLLAAKH